MIDPNERCPASGLTNRECISSDLCDCFPEEEDRFGIHPEYFTVGGVHPVSEDRHGEGAED